MADQVKDESLFDSPPLESFSESGSIYNDFDCTRNDLLDTRSQQLFCFSQTTNFLDDVDTSQEDRLVQEAVDHAIMEEGLYANVNSNLQWDTPLFDNFGDINARDYMAKVYTLATDNETWHDLTFTKESLEMFQRRLRTTWEGPDTVYEAWLIRKGFERPCFDYHTFHLRYPNCIELIDAQGDDEDDDNDENTNTSKIGRKRIKMGGEKIEEVNETREQLKEKKEEREDLEKKEIDGEAKKAGDSKTTNGTVAKKENNDNFVDFKKESND